MSRVPAGLCAQVGACKRQFDGAVMLACVADVGCRPFVEDCEVGGGDDEVLPLVTGGLPDPTTCG